MKRLCLHSPFFILPSLAVLFMACTRQKNDAAEPARLKNYDALLAKAQKQLSAQVYDSAFFYFNQAKNACMPQDDAVRFVYPLISMTGIQQMQGDFSGSEASAVEALPYLKNVEAVYAVSVYNQLGIAYEQQLDYENALKSYRQALRLSSAPLEKAILQNNLAVVAMDQKDYPKAVSLLKPLLKNQAVSKDSISLARIMDNLGFSLFKSGNPSGIGYMEKALAIRELAKDDFGLVTSHFHIAHYYGTANEEKSRQHALAAYHAATRIGSADDRLEVLGAVIKYAQKAEARHYALIHVALNDSLNQARQSAKNQFAKIRYDDKLTKEENAVLKLDRQRQDFRNTLLTIVVFFVSALAIVIIYFLRKRHQKQKILEAYKAEIRMSGKIHDELANDIHNLITLTGRLEWSDDSKKEAMLSSLDSLYARARNISKMGSAVDTGENYPVQLLEMLNAYNGNGIRIFVSGHRAMPWDDIAEDRKIALYRVMQELMVNMKKHSRADRVAVQFSINGKKAEMAYTDNGVGIKDKAFLKNGLQNAENRMRSIGGTISFDTEQPKGLQVAIRFPVKN